MQKEFSRSLRLMVEAVGLQVFGNVGVVEDDFATAIDGGVALGDCRLAGPERFDLRSGQHQAGFERLADLVVEAGAPVVGAPLEVRLFLFGGHVSSQALSRPACTIARRIRASVASLTGRSGNRVSARARPSRLSAYFAPLTPGSAKMAEWRGARRSWIFSA